MDEYKAQIETYGTSEAQQPDQPSQPDDIDLPSADSSSPSRATGGGGSGPPHVRGGPSKIAGIQKSAADAQAEREKFQQNRGVQDEGCDDGSDGQSQGTSQVGQGEQNDDGPDFVDDTEGPVRTKPIPDPKLRGGPKKINAILESARNAQAERERAAKENEGQD